MLKALANRHRLIIVCQLIEKMRSVGEPAALLEIRDSTVSQHLALLRKDGLVAAQRDGQTIWYSIRSPRRGNSCAPSIESIARRPRPASRKHSATLHRCGGARALRQINDRARASGDL